MRVSIPPNDVPFIDPATGLVSIAWYDALKALESLRLIDLADVPQAPPTTNGFKPLWSTATNSWTWG